MGVRIAPAPYRRHRRHYERGDHDWVVINSAATLAELGEQAAPDRWGPGVVARLGAALHEGHVKVRWSANHRQVEMRKGSVDDVGISFGDAEKCCGFGAAAGIGFDDGKAGAARLAVTLQVATTDATAAYDEDLLHVTLPRNIMPDQGARIVL